MLTIDWKERLKKDTAEYLDKKLPNNDFDFEIIFIAYPERVDGQIPPAVVNHVAQTIVQKLGKKHDKYLPFYKYLWEKKGEAGQTAFIAIMAKLLPKKPELYMPLVEKAVNSAAESQLNTLLDKVMLPRLRKQPEKYLHYAYEWVASPKEIIRKQAVNLLVKLMRREPELRQDVLQHFVNQWLQPLEEQAADHVMLLKAVHKMDPELYLELWQQHGQTRDPQSAEILCASILDYHPQIEEAVEPWTKSGNARLKKAALAAQRILQKKKPK
ncbi:MAG: hypothetical protein WCY21_00275 [Candidatus Cloacimonadaceae bacterium]|nr:hypothetical protein [Candidatus Cloacimonadota bacterium]MDX9948905.1 hypothetical protein [Candidatus Syntrophosphaera sp.]